MSPNAATARFRALARRPRAEAPAPKIDGTSARIRLYDTIDSWGDWRGISASEFAGVLDGLPTEVSEIRLHINSSGGDVFDAIAITNLLRAHPARVVAIVDGLAASAASFIAVAADETVMGPHAELMIHDAWGACVGNAADMESMAATLNSISENIASMYAAKAGGDPETWRAAMTAETWYSADEAVTAGLADRVAVDPDEDSQPVDRLDLSMYKFAGRAEAPAPNVAAYAGDDEPLEEGEAQDQAEPYRAPLTHLYA